MIREVVEPDAGAISCIYNHYVQNTTATFEESPLSVDDMILRINKVRGAGLPWLVAEDNGQIIGYTYATKWKERSAYRHTVETSVYIASGLSSRGWGTKLYSALFDELRDRSIHTVIGGVTLPNPVSIALHEKAGMEKVAHFRKVGFKQGKWLDVGYWQMEL